KRKCEAWIPHHSRERAQGKPPCPAAGSARAFTGSSPGCEQLPRESKHSNRDLFVFLPAKGYRRSRSVPRRERGARSQNRAQTVKNLSWSPIRIITRCGVWP